jgi:polyisoprenoid-binding protein YceI
MKKIAAIFALAFGLAGAASAETFGLDAAGSTLTAAVMKNESVTVKVGFPALTGSLDPASGAAVVTADLKGLRTGDASRDANVQTYFFELAKKAAYGQASFAWQGKPGQLAVLKAGAPMAVTLTGKLSLHGETRPLSGPAMLSLLPNGAYKASFSGWVVDIKKSKMAAPLAALNKVCPQPHRVGNQVLLSGDLVFKKP